MDREDLDNLCERSILGLVLGMLVFAPLAFGAVDAWAFLVVQALTIGVMLVWALRLWINPKPKLLWPPLCWVVLAFALYAVGRYLTADIEYVARQEMIQVVMYAFLYFAIVNNLYRQDYAQVVSFTLVFLAMGIAAYAVYQFLTHSGHVWNLEAMYPGLRLGTYISPNNLAGFLEMILPLAVAYLLAGRISPLMRIMLGYSALVIMAGIVVTFSRGGWAAAALALLVLLGILIGHRQHRLPAFLLLVVLIGGGAIFINQYLERTAAFIQRQHSDGMNVRNVELELRRDLWLAGVQMWRDHFWWGVGPAHYNYRYPTYRSERIQMQPDRAHNDYVNLLADWGTTAASSHSRAWAFSPPACGRPAGMSGAWKRNSKSGHSNRLAFYVGGLAGLVALAAHSAVDFNLHIPANALVGVTLLALLSSNLRFATEKFWFNLRLPVKLVATLALAGGIFYLGAQEIRHSRETFWLARADQLPDFSPERAAALEKASAADPQNPATTYAIGECYRMQSFNGGSDYELQAKTAMDWFSRGMKSNPFDGNNYMGYGMCLDWLERQDEAESVFQPRRCARPERLFCGGKHRLALRPGRRLRRRAPVVAAFAEAAMV